MNGIFTACEIHRHAVRPFGGSPLLSTGPFALCWNPDLQNLDLHRQPSAPSEDNNFEQGSMSGRRVRQIDLDAAETIVSFAVNATKSFLRSKVLLSGAFAVLLLLVAIPILFEADMPAVSADGTLKCYDGAGNHEPCVAQATTPPSRSHGPTVIAVRPPSWMTTALFQQSSWAITAGDQQASWTTSESDRQASLATSEDDRQESLTTAEGDQPANSTSAPVVRHSPKWGKRQALAACRRHLIPCFFSTLRKGLTRIAYVAASMARPPREHL